MTPVSVSHITALKEMSISELREATLRKDALVVLDVRTPLEYAQGHMEESVNVPLSELVPRVLDGTLKLKDSKVAVICKAGTRSIAGTKELLTLDDGLDICYVPGGMDAWVAAGYPVNSL